MEVNEKFWEDRFQKALKTASDMGTDITDQNFLNYLIEIHRRRRATLEQVSKKSGHPIEFICSEFDKGMFSESFIWDFM